MAWFHYAQNNSGGSFDYCEKEGITHHVVIEAENSDMADQRAQYIGIYFNGCDDGRDCSCCGDRWSGADSEGDAEPMVYGEDARSYEGWCGWMKEGREIAIHPLKGPIEWHGVKKRSMA